MRVPNEAPLEREQRSRCKKVARWGAAMDPQSGMGASPCLPCLRVSKGPSKVNLKGAVSPYARRFHLYHGAATPHRHSERSEESLRVFPRGRSARRGICFWFVAPGFSPASVPWASAAPCLP
jgi:hypothetical protein